MNRKQLLTLCLIGFTNLILSQTTILDSKTGKCLPNVQVINEKGQLLLISNNKGEVNISKTTDSEFLTFHHIGYSDLILSIESLKQLEVIFLSPKATELREVLITDKEPLYLKLTGYYRIYQTKNSEPYYYTDGIINYYLPIKKRKNKVLIEVEEYRSFIRKELLDDQVHDNGRVVMAPGLTRYPYLSKSLFSYELKKGKIVDSLILNKDAIIGSISYDSVSKKAVLDLDLLLPDSSVTYTMFGFKSKIENKRLTEVYDGKIERRNLVMLSQSFKQTLTHKDEPDTTRVSYFTEFFVTNREFVYSKEELKKTNYVTTRSSYYSTQFWGNYEVIPIIEELLDSTLTEQENVFSTVK